MKTNDSLTKKQLTNLFKIKNIISNIYH